jgi:CheY-like chemotaxis protein
MAVMFLGTIPQGFNEQRARAPRLMAQTILLIDDDPDILAVAEAALNRLDYLVLPTGDPQQAIRIAREEPIDLLLTDVVMPLMKGTELADRIQALSPRTKVLLMSGYQTPLAVLSWQNPSTSTPWRSACVRRWLVRPPLPRPAGRGRSSTEQAVVGPGGIRCRNPWRRTPPPP